MWLCFSDLRLADVLDVEIAWIEAILCASSIMHEAAIVAFIDRIVDLAHHETAIDGILVFLGLLERCNLSWLTFFIVVMSRSIV